MLAVLVVDDDELVRKGLCEWLQSLDGFSVIGDVRNAADCLKLLQSKKPDVVLVDIMLPGLSGIELVRQIKQSYPGLPSLILSGAQTPQLVLDGFKAGASGFIPKRTSPEELNLALTHICEGRFYLSPVVTNALVSLALEIREKLADLLPEGEVRLLTDRERELLRLIAEGLTFTEIAKQLSINARSVERIKARVEQKLDAHSLSDLVREAIRLGLVRA